eukprot:8614497-Pyramimonas_sp.AAC.1
MSARSPRVHGEKIDLAAVEVIREGHGHAFGDRQEPVQVPAPHHALAPRAPTLANLVGRHGLPSRGIIAHASCPG